MNILARQLDLQKMILKIIICFFILTIISCKTYKSPTGAEYFSGNLKTCIIDSNALYNEPIVIMKDNVFEVINTDCQARPSILIWPGTWPSNLYLNFKIREYAFMYKPVLTFSDSIHIFEHCSVSYKTDFGNIKYNKKKKILTLISKKNNWTKSFLTSYSPNDSTLVLSEFKSTKK